MEEVSPLQTLTSKLTETVERSAELITENKPYEFTQKIKMLAQRKLQTNKLPDAEILLKLGIQKMLAQQEVDYNSTHDLIVSLLELYENNKTFCEKDKIQQIYTILTTKQNERNTEYFVRILKNLSSAVESPQLVQYVVSSFEKKEQFHKAENFLIKADLSRVLAFLQKWHQKVDNDEYAIIVSRMALIKGYHSESFDQSMVLLSELDALNPFVKFVKFLILSVQMKSKESYDKIGNCYKVFLKADGFFAQTYENYGKKFFNKQKGGAGLMTLFEK